MLFNARQAALEMGYLTLSEFAHATTQTLSTYERLEKQRGHIYNWYDIETLQPIAPRIVSAVDSGNLAASLLSLHGGALDLLKRPLLEWASFRALWHLRELAGAGTQSAAPAAFAAGDATGLREAVRRLLKLEPLAAPTTPANELEGWYRREAEARRLALVRFIAEYAPWLLTRASVT